MTSANIRRSSPKVLQGWLYLGNDSLHAPVPIDHLADREVDAHCDGGDDLVLRQIECRHHEVPAMGSTVTAGIAGS
jgi:hypothetical protein